MTAVTSTRAWVAVMVLWLLITGCGDASSAGSATPAPPTAPTGASARSPQAPAVAPEGSATPAASTPPPTAAGSCQPSEQLPVQSGSHLIGDNPPPVPYNSTPPTSGWHASGAFEIAVQPPGEPLSEPRQVSVLEAGGVVVSYTELDQAARTQLEQHVRDHHAGRVAVTPYAPLQDGEVAFTAWGVLQRCDGVDLAALDAFVTAHAAAEVVRPGHGH